MKNHSPLLVSGTSNPGLAQKIAKLLNVSLVPTEFTVFPNQETRPRIKKSLKGKTVFILQSFSAPPDKTLIEFLLLTDATKNAQAKKIIGVIPWLGYSAQDKIFRPGEPLSSKLVATLIRAAGMNNVILLDPHSPNNLAHLKKAGIKTTCLSALNIFVQRFQPKLKNKKDWLVLCLDKGAQKRSRAFAQKLKLPMARLKKSRDLSSGKVTFKDFTRDLRNKNIISFDDFVSTGQSRVKAAKLVKKIGAKTYIDCITHGLLGPGASDNLQKSSINQIFLTDSYPIPPKKRFPKLKILTCAHLLARAIQKLA